MTPRMDGLAWAMLLALSVVWGTSFLLAEIILTELPVATTVAGRVVIAAATLWLAILVTGTRMPRERDAWVLLLILAMLNNVVPFLLIVWGQTHITGGLAAVLNATTPIFTGLLAGLMLPDERLTGPRMLGFLLGLFGVAVVVGPSALGSLGADLLAELAILGASASYAVAAVTARRASRLKLRPLHIAAGQTTLSGAILVPVALLVDAPWTLSTPGVPVLAALAAFGVVCTALAYILFFEILARAGTNAVLVTVLIPVVAVVVGAVTLGEQVSLRQILGMGLILLGLSVVDGRLWRGALRRAGSSKARASGPN